MPSATCMDLPAPYWDFLASLEQPGSRHPLFSQTCETENQQQHGGDAATEPPFAPCGWAQFFGGPGGMPHHEPPSHGPPPQHHNDEEGTEKAHEDKSGDKDVEMNNDNDNGEGPSGQSGSDNKDHPRGRGHHGRCEGERRGRGGRGGPGGFGFRHHGHRHGPPHHGPGPHNYHHGSRGPCGRSSDNPFASMFDPSNMAAHLWNQFNAMHCTNAAKKDDTGTTEDYTPDADVFDTDTAFVVHISLPGAKKEDVGVNWDAEKSELSVAGVIYRPGDEEFLKTLALNERKVGAFQRKMRLGTHATPAHVDAEGITAKLEDGVLRVEVPKMDSGYVEIRKVDIE
ncbi:hypothetical protein J1614_006975 [Plenodomus biglobosus]|nr:hypothetical protein J1614_006975 [Plenodomus biglobosus]